jgi:hypothetical protein
MTDDIVELLTTEGDHAETHDLPDDARPTRIGTTRSSVFSVRLNNDDIEALQRVAATAGLPASTLVRTWILDGISADAGTDLRSIVRQEVRSAVREALAG